MRRYSQIYDIGQRYRNNIVRTRQFQTARRDFDREGYDIEFRAANRAAGINNFARMYQDRYPREVYMGVRAGRGSGT